MVFGHKFFCGLQRKCQPSVRYWRNCLIVFLSKGPVLHEHHWGSVNSHWVCMNAFKSLLTPTHVVRKTDLCENSTASECNWVHVRTCEWVLNTPWTLLSAHEHLLDSIEHTLNADEYMWMPLRSVNIPWTSIECTLIPLSKYLEGQNAHI